MRFAGGRQNGDVVALVQHRRAAGNDDMSLVFHRADQITKVENIVQLHDAAAMQNAPLGNFEAHQLGVSLGKRADRQRLRAGKQARNLLRGFQLRVDNHGQAELLTQIRQLLAVIRVAHTRNGRQLAARLFGDRAAKQIQLVRPRDGDHQIRFLKPGFHQHAQACAVAADAHHIEHLRRVAHNAFARIHNGDIMPLAHQLFGQRMADLAAAHNNDAQALRLFPRRFGLHVFLPPPSSYASGRYDAIISSLL